MPHSSLSAAPSLLLPLCFSLSASSLLLPLCFLSASPSLLLPLCFSLLGLDTRQRIRRQLQLLSRWFMDAEAETEAGLTAASFRAYLLATYHLPRGWGGLLAS